MTSPQRAAALVACTVVILGLAAVTTLTASAAPSPLGSPVIVERGPYLQNVGTEQASVIWRTDSAVVGGLRYGRVPGPPWEYEVTLSVSDTEHVVALDDLIPGARYSYQLLGDGAPLGGVESFRTYPPKQSTRPFRFVAFGDSGNASGFQLQTAAALDTLSPPADMVLALGDLVYETGAWEDYDPKFFQPYRNQLRQCVLWPTIGNHDSGTAGGAPFFANFHLPTDSGAPSNPSGTEAYYSFNYGNAHFVCLDTCDPINVGDDQYNWLEDDLDAANADGARWKIVFTHKPPYTKGTYDSFTTNELINLQDVLVPLIESKGVDLFLAGHSHVYERSFLASSDAVLDNDLNDYVKVGNDGTLYVVSGCGGKTGNGPLDHPLMAYGLKQTTGFSVFDVSDDEIRGYFLEGGTIGQDSFSLRKAPDTLAPRLTSVTAIGPDLDQVKVTFNEPVQGGTGASGAENPANYSITGGVTVLSASLQSDGRTVLLNTSSPTQGLANVVFVSNVVDQAPVANQIAPGSAMAYALLPTAGVPEGDTWRYFEGLTFPGATWMQPGFDDSAWPQGPAGIGYSDGDDATLLTGMSGNYLTVYKRRAFNVADSSVIDNLVLRLSYDDGFVAFLNGVEVARSNVPVGQDETTPASGSHEADGFEVFDLTGFIGLLVDGENVLAVEGHNQSLGSGDFSLHAVLSIIGVAPSGEQAPESVLLTDVTTANSPATVRFDAGFSFDGDGEILSYVIDFGDGSTPVSTTEATHVYGSPGLYTASLIVTDDSGLQAVDEVPIFVHNVGIKPNVVASVDDAFPEAGTMVTFQSWSSTDPDGGDLLFHWLFDDPDSGEQNLATGPLVTHTYATPGDYTAKLLVTDDEGSQVSLDIDLGVGGTPPPPGGGGGDGGGGGGCYIVPAGPGGGGTPDPGYGLSLAVLAGLLLWRAQRARARLRGAGLARR